MAEVEILARVERRRKWTEAEKAALLAEVEAEGGKVSLVARRHRVAESLLYNWRSTCKAAAAARCGPEPLGFMPIGVVDRGDDGGPALLAAPQAARSERVERPGPRERSA